MSLQRFFVRQRTSPWINWSDTSSVNTQVISFILFIRFIENNIVFYNIWKTQNFILYNFCRCLKIIINLLPNVVGWVWVPVLSSNLTDASGAVATTKICGCIASVLRQFSHFTFITALFLLLSCGKGAPQDSQFFIFKVFCCGCCVWTWNRSKRQWNYCRILEKFHETNTIKNWYYRYKWKTR